MMKERCCFPTFSQRSLPNSKIIKKGFKIAPVKDVHGKTPLDYALEGGNGKVATLFQELQNVDTASREKPKAIDTELVDGFDFPDEVPEFLSDANVSVSFSTRFLNVFLGNSGEN